MDIEQYQKLKRELFNRGYTDFEWAEKVKPPEDAYDFLIEFIFVICNSGFRAQNAQTVFNRIIWAMKNGIPVWDVFKNFGKVNAINHVWGLKNHYFKAYLAASDVVEFCGTLPWIGNITKFHLARNLGEDCMKPDRHLVRIADKYGVSPFELCDKLSQESGDRIGSVDVVLWRSAILKLI